MFERAQSEENHSTPWKGTLELSLGRRPSRVEYQAIRFTGGLALAEGQQKGFTEKVTQGLSLYWIKHKLFSLRCCRVEFSLNKKSSDGKS